MTESVSDWLSGQRISLRGRKKVLRAAGIQSKTGDAARQLGGFSRLLERQYGYEPGDFLELSYRGRLVGAEWTPEPYLQTDCEVPLTQSTELVRRQLRWYDTRLPADLELHLIGYSLGGVVLFEAATELLRQDPGRWRRRLRSLITLASPLFGTDLGAEGDLLGLLGVGSLLLPGGTVAQELVARGSDPAHRRRVEQDAALLRSAGVHLLTLADDFDTVVTPEDAVIAPADERARFVLASPRLLLGGRYEGAILGHGPLLDNPKAWELMVEVIGSQEPRLRTGSGAIPLGPRRSA